jgi:UDP-N-acetylglucosamine transferase subunit ALG13
MGNHQAELVNQLSKLNYVIKTNVKEIKQLFEGELP